MRLPVVKGKDNKILRAISKPVQKITREILTLIEDMKKTMKAEKGVVCLGLIRKTLMINDSAYRTKTKTKVSIANFLAQ